MGYRSEVKSVIYGPKDKIDALITHTTLIEPSIVWKDFKDSLTRYSSEINHYEPDGDSYKMVLKPVDIIFLQGDNWKWYPGYSDVQAWHALLTTAETAFGLDYEFNRVGEDTGDIVSEGSGNAHGLLSVTTPTIVADFNTDKPILIGLIGETQTHPAQENAS